MNREDFDGIPMSPRGSGKQRARWSGRVRVAALLACLALLPTGGDGGTGDGIAVASPCETPFVVFTDPANPGERSQSGDIAVTRDSGLLGEFGGDGRFASYAIDGSMGIIQNTASGMARVQGGFIARSPDGESSITVSYTGQVDFGALLATGNFVVVDGTGEDAGYRAAGTIDGTVSPPATLQGVDIGLC